MSDFIGERRTGINQSVTDDVANVFKGKTMSQLSMLHEQIKKKLKGGEGVDVGEWRAEPINSTVQYIYIRQ